MVFVKIITFIALFCAPLCMPLLIWIWIRMKPNEFVRIDNSFRNFHFILSTGKLCPLFTLWTFLPRNQKRMWIDAASILVPGLTSFVKHWIQIFVCQGMQAADFCHLIKESSSNSFQRTASCTANHFQFMCSQKRLSQASLTNVN